MKLSTVRPQVEVLPHKEKLDRLIDQARKKDEYATLLIIL